ncbi:MULTISPECIES: 6-carboxytetrahydropterin synthase [unclassified Halomonas]|uniref:6-carboxytetrahydropterin synthase n=1 Tax=unclassified Halomonas TaxID=2609666 RepID=UPI0006DB1D01|nr:MULTISPECIES: 6-carboxytetrahydropterin synthase [unclassified Halomonas]KPQ22052.1 MAG: 6-carboxytetrahydropterin synthase QueD [Halomonas sp. HL-93]SBR48540.1 6-pyruvoyl tetrahydropterin synthase [Halomonas sp. HL-93]SNY96236.1 6-pyruvoyl tetrahydropterin synthase [Halomonas sp. hl-4]
MSLFVNQLTHIDASLWCSKEGLKGVSWQVDALLEGKLGVDGMLFDFGEVKPWIKHHLDTGLDHTLLVPVNAPGVTINECEEGLCVATTTPYAMEVKGPEEAFTLLPVAAIERDAVAETLSAQLTEHRPNNVTRVHLTLSDEAIEGAAYGYSHGLKRHAGNCQRIAHGHRSRLHIWQQGARQRQLEQQWAAWLDDRYLVEADDIIEHDRQTLTCRYQAAQGTFSLTLPSERCAVLTTPTTVENIASWLADKIAAQSRETTKVLAFEGFNKGAIAVGEL